MGLMVWLAEVSEAEPMGTAFTYQGRLIDTNEPADGIFEFQFELYDSAEDGNQLDGTFSLRAVDVMDGYFTVVLDFGSGVFDGEACWLEIGVRPSGTTDPLTTLTPRQKVTPTPYALYAASGPGVAVPLSLSGSSPAPIISGTNFGAGTGVYGEAADTGNITNYGGYFKAAGKYGRAVYGEGTGESSRGVLGETSGKYGIGVQGTASGENSFGVYGYASKTGDVANYGGYFVAGGDNGRGVYGKNTGISGCGVYGDATGTGSITNYGGYFVAAGEEGRGVYGEATDTGDVNNPVPNYGGYFMAASSYGRAVYGSVTGSSGIGVYGFATGISGISVYGMAIGSSGIGVEGYGNSYDFYAVGPGINYGVPSSIRWKSDIRAIDEPLEKVMQVRGVYFNWDAEHGGEHDVGMIAEEVGKVLPEIVNYEEDGIYTTGMDYSKLTPLLVEAVKELKTDLDELKVKGAEKYTHIAAQQKQIEELQREVAQLKHLLKKVVE